MARNACRGQAGSVRDILRRRPKNNPQGAKKLRTQIMIVEQEKGTDNRPGALRGTGLAVVHLDVQQWSGKLAGANARASDVFTLLKCDGQWKITHKLFHWH